MKDEDFAKYMAKCVTLIAHFLPNKSCSIGFSG